MRSGPDAHPDLRGSPDVAGLAVDVDPLDGETAPPRQAHGVARGERGDDVRLTPPLHQTFWRQPRARLLTSTEDDTLPRTGAISRPVSAPCRRSTLRNDC